MNEMAYEHVQMNLERLRLTRIGDHICRDEWLDEALVAVLRNHSSRTPGVDDVARSHLSDERAQYDFIHDLRGKLKSDAYGPQFVRRI